MCCGLDISSVCVCDEHLAGVLCVCVMCVRCVCEICVRYVGKVMCVDWTFQVFVFVRSTLVTV